MAKRLVSIVHADPADIQVAAEYIQARLAGECTSAQHEAIAHDLLRAWLILFALDHRLQTPAMHAIARRAPSTWRPPHHTLPRARRAK